MAKKVKKKSISKPFKINRALALEVLREESMMATIENINSKWLSKIKKFSQICDDGISKTHIAFLATSLLAKSINAKVDLYAIKPAHSKKNPFAYSARSLCHSVIVPAAAELGFNIGVTGREPLNNQPYFRMTKLGDKTPVHTKGKAAFEYMLELINDLSQLKKESSAREVLRTFIFVRKRFQKNYSISKATTNINPNHLPTLINRFLDGNSEGGRLAQAIVAGLIDTFAGSDNVDCGRINDPSRKYPGDVCVRSTLNKDIIDKSFEVRDKPVNLSDVQIFGKKCMDMNVREAAIVMVSSKQTSIDFEALEKWISNLNLGMTLFYGWKDFVEQVLFWSNAPKIEAARMAVSRIDVRLIESGASAISISKWQKLIS